jgi:hypothetical protein
MLFRLKFGDKEAYAVRETLIGGMGAAGQKAARLREGEVLVFCNGHLLGKVPANFAEID